MLWWLSDCLCFVCSAHAKQILHVNKWSIPDILDKYSPVRSRRSASRSPPAATAGGAAATAGGAAQTRYCTVCAGNPPETDFTAPKVSWLIFRYLYNPGVLVGVGFEVRTRDLYLIWVDTPAFPPHFRVRCPVLSLQHFQPTFRFAVPWLVHGPSRVDTRVSFVQNSR